MTWGAITNWPGTANGPAWAAGVPAVGGKVYTGGGDDGVGNVSTQVHAYDPAANTWTLRAAMATRRSGRPASVVTGGLLYVFGGLDSGLVATSAAEVYNPATNTWTTLASMPTARNRIGAVAYGGSIYVFMGNVGGTTVYVYSIPTNTWTVLTPAAASVPLTDPTGAVLGDRIYLTGDTRVTKFNPLTNDWDFPYYVDVGSMPQPSVADLAVFGTKLVLWGGTIGTDVWTRTPVAGESLPVNAATAFTGLGESAPFQGGSAGPKTGDAIYLIPRQGDVTKQAYKLTLTPSGVAVASVLGDVGEFRYPYRWPDLIEKWGGTDEEWDKVNEAFSYDESTGTFRGR